MANSNDISKHPIIIKKIDFYFAIIQYSIMILNALLILNNFLSISLNVLAATLLLVSFIYLWKIRNPFYPYLTFAMMICYFVITVEIFFDPSGTFVWLILQIIVLILFFPWLIYTIKTIRIPLVGRDKILRMWTTYSFVEDEKDREDYTNGIDHAKIKLRKQRKEIRGKYNALIIQIMSTSYTVFFIATYLYGLL